MDTIRTQDLNSHDGPYSVSELNHNVDTYGNESEVSAPFKQFKIVPVEYRQYYKYHCKSPFGGHEFKDVSNSDILYLDTYMYNLRDNLYT